MNPIKVSIDDREMLIPQSWSHCDADTALRICQDLNDGSTVMNLEELNNAEKLFGFKLLLTTKLLNVDMEWVNKYSHQEKENFIGKMSQLMEITNWLFTPVKDAEGNNTGQLKIATTMTNIRDILHEIQIPGKGRSKTSLIGPDNNGKNLVFGEFMAADESFLVYCRAKSANVKKAALTNMIAVLYREKIPFRERIATKHDARVPFQSNFSRYSINQRMELLNKIVPGTLEELGHLVLFFWASYREYLFKKYPNCFTGSGMPHPYGWDAVVDSLAGDFTATEKIKISPVEEVFKTLAIKEYNRAQQEAQL